MKTFLKYPHSKTFEKSSVSRGTMIMQYHTSTGSPCLTYTLLNFMYMQRNSNMHNMQGLHLVILISYSNHLQIPLHFTERTDASKGRLKSSQKEVHNRYHTGMLCFSNNTCLN